MIKAVELFIINLVFYLQLLSKLVILPISTVTSLLAIILAVVFIDDMTPYRFEQFSHRFFSYAATNSPIFESSTLSATNPTISKNHDTSPVN